MSTALEGPLYGDKDILVLDSTYFAFQIKCTLLQLFILIPMLSTSFKKLESNIQNVCSAPEKIPFH